MRKTGKKAPVEAVYDNEWREKRRMKRRLKGMAVVKKILVKVGWK